MADDTDDTSRTDDMLAGAFITGVLSSYGGTAPISDATCSRLLPKDTDVPPQDPPRVTHWLVEGLGVVRVTAELLTSANAPPSLRINDIPDEERANATRDAQRANYA